MEINGIHNNDCAKCHSSLRPDVQTTINAGKGASGIPVNCENCHTGHTGAVHNNLSTAQPCSTCHDTADFDAIYTVHGSDCLTCHASTNNQMVKDTINRGAGADGLAVDCISCHGNLDHNSVHNKTLLPPDGCTNCHVADVKVEHVDKHALGCVTCHSSIDPKVQAAIVKGMGLNGKDVYCADCHIGTNHNAAHDQTFVPDAACSTCHYQDVATEHVNKRGLDCLVCHGNTTFDQIIDSGMSDNLPGPVPVYCTTCHNPVVNHDTAHSNTAVPSTSCSTCHSADVGVVHVTERKLSCSVCHENSAYSSVINHAAGVTVTCAQCHGTITDHNSAHDNALIDTDGCVKCHAADVVVEHVTNRALTCFTCHSSIDPTVMQTIATGKSGTAVYCTTCHVTQTGHSSAHDMTVLPNTTCADCHAANVVTEHVDKRGIACSLCHSSTNTDIISAIATGKAGSPVNCYACHPAVDHKADHNMVAFPTTQAIGCTTCHDVNVVGEHVEKRALSCLVCHNNPAYAAAIASGIAGTVVTCDQCHGQPQHHLSSDAQNGLCVKCHTVSAEYKDAPVQGPCRQCHINTSNFVQGLNPTRVVHAYNTLGKISDFGACVACHVPRSSTFKPFHAKPTVGRQPTDPSIAVPGRGTFNLFYSEFNRSREGGEGSRWGSEDRNYKNQQQAWSQPAISYNMLVVSHAGVSYTVPTFDVPPPTIISLDKTSSFVGTTVKITGTKFGATKGTSYVLFGTAAQVLDGTATKVTTSAWSDTNISFVVPSNTIGTWYLKVVVNNVSSNTKTFAIVSPTITSLDKTSGRVGTIVKITGTNFGVTKGTSYIMFGTQSQLAAGTATKVTTSSWSATSMNFTVPSKTRGVWYIKVVVNGVSSNIVSFTIS
ncbi:MAG: hypothetical protein A2511_15095 [Deltaproteobacteria bacterium RIFOXYD12_FULL_50_9]|nr:MAG: hypothetical protein A2511_15095 [Deltaproteobacteria bacterium RIFOXYD12_FULL_50_9]